VSAMVALRMLSGAFVALGLAALMSAATMPTARVRVNTGAAPDAVLTDPKAAHSNLDSAAKLVAARDLFRRSRRPSDIAGNTPVPAIELVVARPELRLLGMVTGPSPTAVIVGLPGGPEIRVVRQGDVVAGFTVRRISSFGVEVRGMDTTWLLTVGKP
jgi:hypothetical protein